MAMYKGFRVFEKSKPPSPHSVLLEYKGKENTLLFESHAVAVLCESSFKLLVHKMMHYTT